jgi:molybdate transport system permease protein
MLAGNIPGKTATIPIAIYFSIQAGDMNQALILVGTVLVVAFAALAAITYWKGKTYKSRSQMTNRESVD